jgi:hypothetical protein
VSNIVTRMKLVLGGKKADISRATRIAQSSVSSTEDMGKLLIQSQSVERHFSWRYFSKSKGYKLQRVVYNSFVGSDIDSASAVLIIGPGIESV